jgi:hypothetical protein
VRLITDWVEKGLLDRPTVRGLGRGKGTLATWPEEQLQLFLLLLGKRRELKRTATLCNIPVGLWLIWGDRYAPLRQVRRALATWADAYATVKHGRAERTALQLLEQVAHPEAEESDRLRFELLITRAATTGDLDREEFTRVATRVVDPHHTGIARGHYGTLDTNALTRTIDWRVTGLTHLDASDETYEQARRLYRATGATEARHRDPNAAQAALVDPSVATATTRASLEAAMNNACLDLVTLIGLTFLTPPVMIESDVSTDRPRSRDYGPGARHTERTLPHANPD